MENDYNLQPTEEEKRTETQGDEEIAGMSWFSRFINVFLAPSETFESIRLRPSWTDWLLPVIILSVISFFSNLLIYDIAINDYRAKYQERLESNEQLSPEKRQELMERFDKQTLDPTRRTINTILSPVFILLAFAVIAAALWFTGNIILGGETRYILLLGVVATSSLIDIVASAVKVPLIYFSGSSKVFTGLGLVLEESNTFFYRFFVKWDLFSFWKIAVMGIGMAVIYRFSPRKGIITVGILWLIYIALISFIQGLGFGLG